MFWSELLVLLFQDHLLLIVFSYSILQALSSIFNQVTSVHAFNVFSYSVILPTCLFFFFNLNFLLLVWSCGSPVSDTFLFFHLILYLLSNPINLISASTPQVGSDTQLLSAEFFSSSHAAINSLPMAYHPPSQFPQIMHWMINISTPYSSSVCDNSQNELPYSAINLVSWLSSIINSSCVIVFAVNRCLCGVIFSGGKYPEFPCLYLCTNFFTPSYLATPCFP